MGQYWYNIKLDLLIYSWVMFVRKKEIPVPIEEIPVPIKVHPWTDDIVVSQLETLSSFLFVSCDIKSQLFYSLAFVKYIIQYVGTGDRISKHGAVLKSINWPQLTFANLKCNTTLNTIITQIKKCTRHIHRYATVWQCPITFCSFCFHDITLDSIDSLEKYKWVLSLKIFSFVL